MNLKRIYSTKGFWIFILLLVAFTSLQFFASPVKNPAKVDQTKSFKAPDEVVSILKRSCYDCHSNESKLGIETKIAPLSWMVAKDVMTARSRFNFSTFDTLSAAEQQGFVWEMVNMVLNGKMPLKSYSLLHPKAKLSIDDIGVLTAYAESISPAVYQDSAAIKKARDQYEAAYSRAKVAVEALPVAATGVAYPKGFRHWQVISTTNRFDNNKSIRVVYANEIAARAVKQNQIAPWPEGSILVKAVWDIIEYEDGAVLPGAFNNVQVMQKDSKRFKDSEGWGFAKFLGVDKVPFGQNASFNATCFNCHKAAEENGYVFNIPLPNGDLLPITEFN